MRFQILVFIAVVAAALIGLANARKRGSSRDTVWPFYARKPLSNPEQVLYFRLCKALPDHIVLAQVALSRILGVHKGNNFAQWYNRINRMSVDFVICSRDASIVAVIELDDASHGRADRIAADAKKDKALASAGIYVIRWQVRALPSEAEIKAMFIQSQETIQSSQPGLIDPSLRGLGRF